jgi:hypothetical protein
MSIQTVCPGCGVSYALDDKMQGKKGRCAKCGQSFIIGSAPPPPPEEPAFEEVKDDATVPTQPAVVAPPAGSDQPVKRKKKKKGQGKPTGLSLRTMIGLTVGAGVLLIVGGTVALVMLLSGPSVPRLAGKWKGAPQVRQAVKEFGEKQKVHSVVSGFAESLVQKAADELLAVKLDFQPTGTVFFSGNTGSIGMPPESYGPWEILQTQGSILTVRMGPAGKEVEAKLAFRDRNTFILTRSDKEDQDPITFSRSRD